MADNERPTEPTEDIEEPRRPKLPEWCRDAAATGDKTAGFIIVGGFPPEYVERHRAREAARRGEPGEDPGPAEAKESPPDYATMGLGSQLLRFVQTGRQVPPEVFARARAKLNSPRPSERQQPGPPDRSTEPSPPEDPSE